MSKVLIVGTHPVVDDVRRQYETAGWTVWCLADAIADDVAMGEFDELFLTTEYVAEPNKAEHQKALAADYAVMALLGGLLMAWTWRNGVAGKCVATCWSIPLRCCGSCRQQIGTTVFVSEWMSILSRWKRCGVGK